MKFRSVVSHSAIVAAMAVALPRAGSAQSFFSTGVSVVAGIDQNWTVSTGFGAFSTTFGSAFLVVPTPWPQSTWISDLTSGTNGSSPWFDFRQTFSLTGFNPATASLAFRWGCDDIPGAVTFTPVYSLNGGALSGSGTCGGYNVTTGSAVTQTTGFVSGLNTIDFFVVGNGTTDGFDLSVTSFTAQPTSTVPEPATVTLLATGLVTLAGMRRRSRA